ncbi:MAG TPA: hypothetical protein VG347_20065 [Verrucomicrobiae bacterium]|nr:hypothetical protein [Verrucomicrobiae bacterium]
MTVTPDVTKNAPKKYATAISIVKTVQPKVPSVVEHRPAVSLNLSFRLLKQCHLGFGKCGNWQKHGAR